jgi:hypothetical protein
MFGYGKKNKRRQHLPDGFLYGLYAMVFMISLTLIHFLIT